MTDLVKQLEGRANYFETLAGNAKPGEQTFDDTRKMLLAAVAEIARLRARPTEEEVTRIVQDMRYGIRLSSEIAQRILALFPKVQP